MWWLAKPAPPGSSCCASPATPPNPGPGEQSSPSSSDQEDPGYWEIEAGEEESLPAVRPSRPHSSAKRRLFDANRRRLPPWLLPVAQRLLVTTTAGAVVGMMLTVGLLLGSYVASTGEAGSGGAWVAAGRTPWPSAARRLQERSGSSHAAATAAAAGAVLRPEQQHTWNVSMLLVAPGLQREQLAGEQRAAFLQALMAAAAAAVDGKVVAAATHWAQPLATEPDESAAAEPPSLAVAASLLLPEGSARQLAITLTADPLQLVLRRPAGDSRAAWEGAGELQLRATGVHAEAARCDESIRRDNPLYVLLRCPTGSVAA